MLDFLQKRKLRSRLYNRWVLGLLGILVMLAIHSTWAVYQKQRESQGLLSLAQAQSDELENRQRELKQKIADLNTTEGLESEIRAKFNVAKPNENVAVVLASQESTTSTTTQKTSFWQNIINFFR